MAFLSMPKWSMRLSLGAVAPEADKGTLDDLLMRCRDSALTKMLAPSKEKTVIARLDQKVTRGGLPAVFLFIRVLFIGAVRAYRLSL